MAEHDEDADAEAAAGHANPAAVALALAKARPGGKLPPEAAAFLRKQSHLIDLQIEDANEQRELHMAHLRARRWKDRATLALQGLTALAGAAGVVVAALLLWDAANDHSLVVEAFHTPPDFAARGEDGQVLAGEVMDRLAAMDAASQSGRASSTYANAWKGEIKVELPQTGVSIGEIRRFLRDWLGHETRISGEAVKTSKGLRLTVRSNADPGFSVEGPEGDLDHLVGLAAEHIYGATQPYQYAKWLDYHGRSAEALAVARGLARNGPPAEQVWAWSEIGDLLNRMGDPAGGARAAYRAAALKSDAVLPYVNAASSEFMLGHDGKGLAAQIRSREQFERTGGREFGDQSRVIFSTAGALLLAGRLGDYRAAAARAAELTTLGDLQGIADTGAAAQAAALSNLHDATGARRLRLRLADPHVAITSQVVFSGSATDLSPEYFETLEVGDWAGAQAVMREAIAAADAHGPIGRVLRDRFLSPRLAWAQALAGDLDAARATIATTPMDCDFCVIVRGRIAGLAKDWSGADRDFAEVARRSPATPFVWEDWGRSLLARGDAKAAAAKAETAVDRGPHFADAYELWGEALLAQGDAAGAADKFEQAAEYAPRWGHNRLMWALALDKAGDANGAHRQRIYARGMDLTPQDRAAVGG
jgi:tetratricopeptide (TPR) repeat protein